MRTARVGRVDVLAAGAGRAIRVDAALALVDLDVDVVVDHRVHPHATQSWCGGARWSRRARCAPGDARPTSVFSQP